MVEALKRMLVASRCAVLKDTYMRTCVHACDDMRWSEAVDD